MGNPVEWFISALVVAVVGLLSINLAIVGIKCLRGSK